MNPGVGEGGAPADQTLKDLERRLDELPRQMQATWARELERLQHSFTAHVQTLEARVNQAMQALDAASSTTPDQHGGEASLSDAFYESLEERFRGSLEEIGARQAAYVADVERVPGNRPVLDLGCGRGEFLGVLQHHGIDSIGVDTNDVALAHCRQAGFEVRHADLLVELRGWPDESLRAVSMLQVVEHLPFEVLLTVLAEARRVLQPGGLLLVETPNGANLTVAASTFWLDPTHVRPLHPLMLQFLVEHSGFADPEIRGSASSTPSWRLGDDVATSPQVEAIRGVQALLLDDQDVTLLAHVEE